MFSARQSFVLAVPPLLLLAGMVLAPSLRLALEEAPAGMQVWQDPWLQGIFVWTLVQASASSVLCLACGLPIAWVLARLEFTGRQAILHSLLLPFVMPTLVAAMGVLALFGKAVEAGPWLLLYGNIFFNLCIVIRTGVDALESVNASQVAAARTLGATAWRGFWRVEWPVISPWLASSTCLVFLYCFSGFGLALILGGQQWATIEVEIYSLVANELQLSKASVLALLVLCVTCVMTIGYSRLEQSLVSGLAGAKVPRHAPQGLEKLAIAVSLTALFLICAAPIVALMARVAANSGAAWQVLFEADTLFALGNTMAFSLAAVALAMVLGLMHAIAAQRFTWMRSAAFLPLMVSPVTVAFGLLLLYPSWSASRGLLILAYAALAFPFVAKSVASGLDAIPRNCLQAARNLGASPFRVLLRVTLPLLAPSLRRGLAFAAATAIGEFAVSLFLARPEWTTLSTLIYQRLGRPGSANLEAALVLSCLLIFLAVGTFLALYASPRHFENTRHVSR